MLVELFDVVIKHYYTTELKAQTQTREEEDCCYVILLVG